MSSEEKTESPTSYKLRQARKRGEIAYSRELAAAASFLAAIAVAWLDRDETIARLEHLMTVALDWSGSRGGLGMMSSAASLMLRDMLRILLPPLTAAAAVALLTGGLQTRGLFSAEPLKLNFERMNPGKALSNLFSSRHGLEVLKMLLKLGGLVGIALVLLRLWIPALAEQVYLRPSGVAAVVGSTLAALFGWAAAMLVVLGVVDYGHQYYEHIKQNRMSKSERKREYREREGDPHLRSELRRRQKELTNAPAKSAVGGASVVVTNPTHYAVALYYEAGVVDLPIVVAKGSDADALSIRRDALRERVPVLEAPPLARGLYRSVALGDAIGDEHVEAVAEVFRWLQGLKASSDRKAPAH